MSDESDIPAPTDSHRFFRASPEVYEGARLYLDAAFGHPKPGTSTCMPPVAEAPTDGEGRAYIALTLEQCAWPEVGPILDDLLASEQVEEVPRGDWESVTAGGEA